MSRRDQVRMTQDEIDEFLSGRHTLQVATIGPSGHPHLVAMWYGFHEGEIAFWTYGRSQKVINLERNPKMTCLVETGDQYPVLQGVELIGTGEIIVAGPASQAVGESVYERYTAPVDDVARQMVAAMGAKRVAVVLHVERVVSWDHRKLGGAY